MILLMLIGIYAAVTKRIRVTHSFQLSGSHAHNFGITLIVVAVPASFLAKVVVRLVMPFAILSNRLYVSLINVGFLAVLLFSLAWFFRDRPVTSNVGSSQPPGDAI